jgi:hypothetical protein
MMVLRTAMAQQGSANTRSRHPQHRVFVKRVPSGVTGTRVGQLPIMTGASDRRRFAERRSPFHLGEAPLRRAGRSPALTACRRSPDTRFAAAGVASL